jgi:hypothetical protein
MQGRRSHLSPPNRLGQGIVEADHLGSGDATDELDASSAAEVDGGEEIETHAETDVFQPYITLRSSATIEEKKSPEKGEKQKKL